VVKADILNGTRSAHNTRTGRYGIVNILKNNEHPMAPWWTSQVDCESLQIFIDNALAIKLANQAFSESAPDTRF
jgi:hypothetical protein